MSEQVLIVDPFVTNDLDAQIIQAHRDVVEAEQQIDQAHRRGLDAALRCGRLMWERKRSLKHGQWLPYLRAHFPEISERSTQRYLKVAKYWDQINERYPDWASSGYTTHNAISAISGLLSHEQCERYRRANPPVADLDDVGVDDLGYFDEDGEDDESDDGSPDHQEDPAPEFILRPPPQQRPLPACSVSVDLVVDGLKVARQEMFLRRGWIEQAHLGHDDLLQILDAFDLLLDEANLTRDAIAAEREKISKVGVA